MEFALLKVKQCLFFCFLPALVLVGQGCEIERVSTSPGVQAFVKGFRVINDSITVQEYLFGGIYRRRVCSPSIFPNINNIEEFSYYPNGSPMVYKMFHDGDLRYYRRFEKDGRVEAYGGSGILYEDSVIYDTLLVNRNYLRDVFFVNPPSAEISVLIGDYVEDEEGRDLQTDPLYFYPVENSKTKYSVHFSSEGTHRVVLYWAIEDALSKDMQKGRVIHEYTVVSNDEQFCGRRSF